MTNNYTEYSVALYNIGRLMGANSPETLWLVCFQWLLLRRVCVSVGMCEWACVCEYTVSVCLCSGYTEEANGCHGVSGIT